MTTLNILAQFLSSVASTSFLVEMIPPKYFPTLLLRNFGTYGTSVICASVFEGLFLGIRYSGNHKLITSDEFLGSNSYLKTSTTELFKLLGFPIKHYFGMDVAGTMWYLYQFVLMYYHGNVFYKCLTL